jgi:hypothetical protein
MEVITFNHVHIRIDVLRICTPFRLSLSHLDYRRLSHPPRTPRGLPCASCFLSNDSHKNHRAGSQGCPQDSAPGTEGAPRTTEYYLHNLPEFALLGAKFLVLKHFLNYLLLNKVNLCIGSKRARHFLRGPAH